MNLGIFKTSDSQPLVKIDFIELLSKQTANYLEIIRLNESAWLFYVIEELSYLKCGVATAM